MPFWWLEKKYNGPGRRTQLAFGGIMIEGAKFVNAKHAESHIWCCWTQTATWKCFNNYWNSETMVHASTGYQRTFASFRTCDISRRFACGFNEAPQSVSVVLRFLARLQSLILFAEVVSVGFTGLPLLFSCRGTLICRSVCKFPASSGEQMLLGFVSPFRFNTHSWMSSTFDSSASSKISSVSWPSRSSALSLLAIICIAYSSNVDSSNPAGNPSDEARLAAIADFSASTCKWLWIALCWCSLGEPSSSLVASETSEMMSSAWPFVVATKPEASPKRSRQSLKIAIRAPRSFSDTWRSVLISRRFSLEDLQVTGGTLQIACAPGPALSALNFLRPCSSVHDLFRLLPIPDATGAAADPEPRLST